MVLGGWYSDIRFYSNTGTNANPAFEEYIYLVLPDSQTFLNGNPPRIAFADWDGDADLDMITCDYYGSVFLRENVTPTGVAEHGSQVIQAHEFTISPNPAVNRVVFRSRLAESSFIQVDVYTVDGRHVASPFHDYAETGTLEITWDIRQDLPTGVYLVNLKRGSSLLTQKLLLMR
ncbi:MAG: T9SS type A sorting domain-containing protein [candidate division WOR-3 bacterium]|nr:MAG: T9SS type A sorting domain-containing protein [candidate division WOR-3 bacterium]